MHQPSPLVSILIVTWNRRRELARAIESALAQTVANKEVVVLDNASTDGTIEMVRRIILASVSARRATLAALPDATWDSVTAAAPTSTCWTMTGGSRKTRSNFACAAWNLIPPSAW